MERLLGPSLEVILSLNEGHDFGYLSAPFVIVASLDGNCIETNTFSAEQSVKLNSELIWQSNKNNIKQMRSYKVPIRLEFYKIESNGTRTHIGYIVISLKSAQYVPKSEYVAIKEECLKVVGLGKGAKGSTPTVKLSLRIQDVEESDDVSSARRDEVIKEHKVCASESSINVVMPVEKPPQLEKVETQSSHSRKETKLNAPVPVPSNLLPQSDIHVYHSLHVDIALDEIKWLASFSMVHFRFHHARADVTWSAHADIESVHPGSVSNVRGITAQLRFVEVPDYLPGLLSEVSPVVTVCTLRQGRPVVLAKSQMKIRAVKEGVVKTSASLLDLKTQEIVAFLSFTATLKDLGPHTFHQLLTERTDECISERVKNELDMWKEKERAALEEESNKRLQSELLTLQTAWDARQKELTAEVHKGMEECKRLSDILQTTSADYKLRLKTCEEREKNLEQSKKDLETSYRNLLSETRQETASLREDLLERLQEKDRIIAELQDKNEQLMAEVEDVKARSNALTKEQTQILLTDVKKLQEKLERENSSKMFFKEQWGKAVREVHRIKTDGWKDIQVQLQYKKDELKQMGLDFLINSDNRRLGETLSSGRESNRGDHGCDKKLRSLISQRDCLLLSEGPNAEEISRLNREITERLEF